MPGRFCLAEKAGQKAEYLVAANEGRQTAAGRCLKSPGRRASSQHHPRLWHSGSRTRCLQVAAELEEIRMRPERIDAGEDLARSGVAGQVRRRVHDIADQVVPAGLDIPFRQEQGAGVNPGMHAKRHQSRRHTIVAQLPDPQMNIDCGFCGTTTVILARAGIAEHGESTVALRPDHAAAVLGHRAMPDLPQLAEELGQVFRLHVSAQDGGPDEVREKHRQSMTFAFRVAGLYIHRRCRGQLVPEQQARSLAGARPDAVHGHHTHP